MIDKLTVVMLVGGRGSRLTPYTDLMPKCLIDVAGKPLLGRILDNLTPLFDRFDVNYAFLVNYLGEKVEKYVTENLDLDAVFLYDKPDADQVSAVLEAKPFVTDAMLLYYGDTIIDDVYKTVLPDYNFAFLSQVEDVSEYGHVTLSSDRIIEIQEKVATGKGLIIVGGYYFVSGKNFLEFLEEENDYVKPSGCINDYINNFILRKEMMTYQFADHISIDTPEDWVMANKYYKENEK